MQHLVAELSRHIDLERFRAEWDKEPEQGQPPVTFRINRQTLTADIEVGSSPWDEENFERTVRFTLHRVDPLCQANWRR
jgi:hypothetical protein